MARWQADLRRMGAADSTWITRIYAESWVVPPANLGVGRGWRWLLLICSTWSFAPIGSAQVPSSLNPRLASKFAGLALAGIGREWPHSYQHLAHGREDMRSPRELHPSFFGC